jgi:RNA polymerase sigma-70 factor (ECF subfamily)
VIDRKKLRDGDERHFRDLVQTFGPLTFRIARRFGHDEGHAEDLFQEIWKQVFEKRGTYSGSGPFAAWLHRVATNTCISDFRAARIRARALRRMENEGKDFHGGWRPPDPLAETERSEWQRRLHAAMAQLPDRELEAITLRIFERKTPGEVSDIMGIARTTVRCHISRGVKRLRGFMNGTVPEGARQEVAS